MNKLKHISLITLLIVSLTLFNSCSKESIQDNITSNVSNNDSNAEDNYNDDYYDEGYEDNNNTNNNTAGGSGEITLYKVEGEYITKIKDYKVSGQDLNYQKDTAKHLELWQLVKDVVPPSYRNKMSEFVIYNGGSNGTAGFVIEKNQELSKWKMGIAIDYADDRTELVYTVIHEFGHILTLNNDQVDGLVSEDSCNNYFTGEGCSKTPSYINKLQSKYWADIWTNYLNAQNSESALNSFYNKNKSRFVTQYASTNPGEDIAEVFATFVTKNNTNGNTIADKKIQLMYQHPELVNLRNYIRKNLGTLSKNRAYTLPTVGSWKKANTFGNTKHSHCSHYKK